MLRIHAFLLWAACLAVGCAPYAAYPPPTKMIPLALAPHQDPVDVFFPGEKLPVQYLRMEMLEASGPSRETFSQLVERLKAQARTRGYDGLLITQQNNGWNEWGPVREVFAIGILYPERLTALDQLVRTETFHLPEDQEGQVPYFTIHYRPDGQPADTLKASTPQHRDYLRYIKPFDLHFLVEDTRRPWMYRHQKDGVIRQRRYGNPVTSGTDQMVYVRLLPSYDSTLQQSVVRQVTVTQNLNLPNQKIFTIDLTYNAQAQLTEKRVAENGTLLQREVFEFNADGRPDGRLVYRYHREEEKLVLYSYYDYYTVEALTLEMPE